MDNEKLIEDLRGLLKQYGEKIPYGELVGAPWPYSRSGDLVWQDPEPYFIEQASTALSTLQAENAQLRADLERMKRERDALTEDFVDYVTGGVPNPAIFCKNRCNKCVDMRGWCTGKNCKGFYPSGASGQKED